MPQFFLNKRLIILLVSIIILVALIGFSLRDRDKLTWPEQLIKDTTGFVQNVFSRPANSVAGFFDNLKDLQNTYKENKELKSRLDDLAQLEAQVQQLNKENIELRGILEKEENLRKYDPIQATVISRNPDRWQELLTINKGSVHGIKANMAVITSKGLIGKVKNPQQFTSTVQLLSTTDPKNRISASILGEENGEVSGMIEGYDNEKKMLLLKRIPYEAKVKKDQIVVTSRLSGLFPEGLVIGRVVEVFPDQFGLTQTAYIKPEADLYDIDHVIVAKKEMDDSVLEEILQAEKEEEMKKK
ncbi:rod shape-determining protein MreC [Bacillus aquiflavi]|uniref:Cell shape-determining protein MreC n=1 Tax=Bacillus aquiflavi TaxID=2672567 RepID=A0A6B3VT67_9BACI|nr:rod shape-determining protein MreC [Bacillus aquiflavi]MBA4537202.1 rod shape-determining protein MreC [Bacillus aquiflavi]NEY81460.1 rod shape-determining protein MreC [Bacillus aquiflavi]UAC47420.1 rod shape-determining protein MreC [Bacillus aquiflavi]